MLFSGGITATSLNTFRALVGDPVDLSGPDEPVQAWPRLAFSPDLAQGSVVAGAMVTWPARGQLYARAVRIRLSRFEEAPA